MIIDEQEKFIAKSSGRKERTVESEYVSRTFCICQHVQRSRVVERQKGKDLPQKRNRSLRICSTSSIRISVPVRTRRKSFLEMQRMCWPTTKGTWDVMRT